MKNLLRAAMLFVCVLMLGSLPVQCRLPYVHPLHLVNEPNVDVSFLQTSRSENSKLYEYHGLAYDMFSGNPQGETVDLGFQARSLFELTYDKQYRTADGAFIAPDQVNVVTDMSCSFAASSSSYTGMSAYQENLAVSVGVDVGYSGLSVSAAFSASVEYNQMKTAMEEEEKVAVISQAKCLLYHTSLMEKAKLSEDFKAAVEKARLAASFADFIEKWGTHYTHEVSLGAQAIERTFYTRKDVQEMMSMGLDVAVAASLSAYGGYGSLSAEVGFSKEQASKYSSSKKETRESYIGLPPPVEGDARAWLTNIQESFPVPVNFKLTPIVDLFTKEYFGETYNDQQLKDLKGLLNSAILLKSGKSNLASSSDDKLGPVIVDYLETQFAGNNYVGSRTQDYTGSQYLLQGFYICKYQNTLGTQDTYIWNIGPTLPSNLDYYTRQMGTIVNTCSYFTPPEGVGLTHAILYTHFPGYDSKTKLAGIQFFWDTTSSSEVFGFKTGNSIKQDLLNGQLIDYQVICAAGDQYKSVYYGMGSMQSATMPPPAYGIKFRVSKKVYSVVRGFKQYKTALAGTNIGIRFEDPDKPLISIDTRKVIVYESDIINGIELLLTMAGLDFSTDVRGSTAGGTQKELVLAQNEFITTVSIWSANGNINALQFNTSAGQSVKFGKGSGTAIETWTINGHIVGFFGFQGSALKSLGIKYTLAS